MKNSQVQFLLLCSGFKYTQKGFYVFTLFSQKARRAGMNKNETFCFNRFFIPLTPS